jgi:hypothetical protein
VAGALRFNALWSGRGGVRAMGIRGVQHLRWSAPVALALTPAWFMVRNLEFGPFVALHV